MEGVGRRFVRAFKLEPQPPFRPLGALEAAFGPISVQAAFSPMPTIQSMEPAQVIASDQPVETRVIASGQPVLIHDYTTTNISGIVSGQPILIRDYTTGTSPAVVPVSGAQPPAQMPLK